MIITHLPWGPRAISPRTPSLGIGMKYIGHRTTNSTRAPYTPVCSGLYFKQFLCLFVTFISNDCQWMKIVFLDVLFLVNALTSSEELGIPLLMSWWWWRCLHLCHHHKHNPHQELAGGIARIITITIRRYSGDCRGVDQQCRDWLGTHIGLKTEDKCYSSPCRYNL